MPMPEIQFDAGHDNWGHFIIGRQDGKEVYLWYSTDFFANEKKLEEIGAMSPEARYYMVLEYQASEIKHKAIRDIRHIRATAELEVNRLLEQTRMNFDALLNNARENSAPFAEWLTTERAEKFAADSREALEATQKEVSQVV